MLSGAGDAFARRCHRRRDLSNPFNFCHLPSSFWSPLVSNFTLNLPKNPNISLPLVSFSAERLCNGGRFRSLTSLDLTQISFAIPSLNPARVMPRQICNGEREQCFINSLNQTPPTNLSPVTPRQSSDAYPQISEQYFIAISSGSQSGVSQDPPLSPLHRNSLMARVSLGPSFALPSVETSTAHDEPQSWQLGLLLASSPTIVSVLQGGGDSELSLPTSTNLGFGWMGRIPSCGPIAPTWPKHKSCREAHTSFISQALYINDGPSPLRLNPRSAPLNALVSLALKICYSSKNGRRRYSISVTKSLDETCYYKSENLLDRVAWLSLDASLFLKLIGIEFLSNHRWCDVITFFKSRIMAYLLETVSIQRPQPEDCRLSFLPDLEGPRRHPLQTTIRGVTATWIIRSLWSSRNKRIFEKRTISKEETIQEASATEEDWKKAQVDSKKILAQPHQSETAQPRHAPTSKHTHQGVIQAEFPPGTIICQKDAAWLEQRKNAGFGWGIGSSTREIKARHCQPIPFIESDAKSVLTAIVSRKPPLHLTRLTEDILTLAKPFRDLPFRFTPRSQNFVVDDLVKKAARSMTIGPPL